MLINVFNIKIILLFDVINIASSEFLKKEKVGIKKTSSEGFEPARASPTDF